MSNNTRIWSTIGKIIKGIGKAAIFVVPIIISTLNRNKSKN